MLHVLDLLGYSYPSVCLGWLTQRFTKLLLAHTSPFMIVDPSLTCSVTVVNPLVRMVILYGVSSVTGPSTLTNTASSYQYWLTYWSK